MVATTHNDERILLLKKQIEEKKKKLGKQRRFVPNTNCLLELDGIKYNLHTLRQDKLVELLVRLNAYLSSAKSLELYDRFILGAHKVDDWIKDLKSKLDILMFKEREDELNKLELKLSNLLSEGKKVELELDDIQSQLGD